MSGNINHETADDNAFPALILLGGPAPQYGLDPGQQFAGTERFGEIVIGTELEANDHVTLFTLR